MSNGNLRSSALAPITTAANGEQARLRRDAAAAFMAMNAESQRRFGVTLQAPSARVAYRTVAEQQHFWDLYVSGRGALAARPGTSNHGWGLAIDLATPQMRKIVDSIGAKYGWAKAWSDAPGEWWHLTWRQGKYPAVTDARWAGYTVSERRWIAEYDALKAANRDPDRRRVLRRVMSEQRRRVWRAARDSGWQRHNRQERYASLRARTT